MMMVTTGSIGVGPVCSPGSAAAEAAPPEPPVCRAGPALGRLLEVPQQPLPLSRDAGALCECRRRVRTHAALQRITSDQQGLPAAEHRGGGFRREQVTDTA